VGQRHSPYPAARPSAGSPIPRLVLAGVVALAEVLLLVGEVDELTRHFNRNPGPYLHLLIGLLAFGVITGAVLLVTRRPRAARILLLGGVVQVLAAMPGALRLFGVRRGSVFEDVFLPAGVVVVVAVLLWLPAVLTALEGAAGPHGQSPGGYPPSAPPYGPAGGQPWAGAVPPVPGSPEYRQYPQSPLYQQNPQYSQGWQQHQSPQYHQNPPHPQGRPYPQSPQYRQNPQYQQGAQAGPPPGPYPPASH
jgi:hypothetical protein